MTAQTGNPVSALADRIALRWAAARERLTAYLIAADLTPEAAAETGRAVVERLAEAHRPDTVDEAILLALTETRRLLADQAPRRGDPQVSLVPRNQPLPIRRGSLAPALRWRRGRWRRRSSSSVTPSCSRRSSRPLARSRRPSSASRRWWR